MASKSRSPSRLARPPEPARAGRGTLLDPSEDQHELVAEPSTVAAEALLPGPSERLRLLIGTGVGSVVVTYSLMVLCAAAAELTAGTGVAVRLSLTAAIPLWLAAHQVPLVIAGAPLGVLPLLPTAVLVGLTARMASWLAKRLGGRPREDGAAVVASLTGAHASAAVLATALPQSPVQASPWTALLGGGLVAALGSTAGVIRRTGVPTRWRRAPEWARGGLAASGLAAWSLLTASALMLLAAFMASVDDLHGRLETASPTLGSGVGITVLSLCYLPNALVAAVGWLAGPGLSIGPVAVSPLITTPGVLPPIPLMAVMPLVRPPAWTAVVFVLPALAGVLAGVRCRRVAHDPVRRLYAVGVATGLVAVGFGLAAALVSGHLAGGQFDPVEVPALALAGALAGWIGLPAAVTVLSPDLSLLGRGPRRRRGVWPRTARNRAR